MEYQALISMKMKKDIKKIVICFRCLQISPRFIVKQVDLAIKLFDIGKKKGGIIFHGTLLYREEFDYISIFRKML